MKRRHGCGPAVLGILNVVAVAIRDQAWAATRAVFQSDIAKVGIVGDTVPWAVSVPAMFITMSPVGWVASVTSTVVRLPSSDVRTREVVVPAESTIAARGRAATP